MSREKQIEEMAAVIRNNTESCKTCTWYKEGLCWENCELEEDNQKICTDLYNAGYRKQREPISCGHEKGGEWVQLPCKVGDILYVISQMKDKRILPFINEYEVTSIGIKRKSIVIYHEMDGYIKTFKHTDFGKTVFLTRKEAEAKMKQN